MWRDFLTAEWRNLIEVTWAVPSDRLLPWLPAGLEPETRDGRAFASLVAFQFLNTRVLGVRWPGFVSFPEINLRCYVIRRTAAGPRRGICFIREFVPQRVVARVARLVYNEPYLAAPMRWHVETSGHELKVAYEIERSGRRHRMSVRAQGPPALPPPDCADAWFTEIDRGFSRWHNGATLEYEVRHPRWRVYRVADYQCDFDCGLLYGKPWDQLFFSRPVSVVLAEGSAVSVGHARRL